MFGYLNSFSVALRRTHSTTPYIFIDRFFCKPSFLGVRWSTLPLYRYNPMVGAPKRQGCATQLRYRSGYRRCIEQVICKRVSENLFSHATSAAITRRRQVIYCNSIDLWRAVRLNGSLFYYYQMSS